jgi:hypothetical protein
MLQIVEAHTEPRPPASGSEMHPGPEPLQAAATPRRQP